MDERAISIADSSQTNLACLTVFTVCGKNVWFLAEKQQTFGSTGGPNQGPNWSQDITKVALNQAEYSYLDRNSMCFQKKIFISILVDAWELSKFMIFSPFTKTLVAPLVENTE